MTYLQQELTKWGVLLPLPLLLQPLCLKAPCSTPAQARHTDRYASIISPSLSAISSQVCHQWVALSQILCAPQQGFAQSLERTLVLVLNSIT